MKQFLYCKSHHKHTFENCQARLSSSILHFSQKSTEVRNTPIIESHIYLFKSTCDDCRKFATQYKLNDINFEFAFCTDVEEYSEIMISMNVGATNWKYAKGQVHRTIGVAEE